ncbi:MAG TPA: FHA domain-containing protein [Acidimicrobiia bacterium]|nr:FHA domain-containing protein [Acidimicrobiia bacterium]
MFCNQCGHRNPPGSNFCSSCGAALNLGETDDTTMTHVVTPAEERDADEDLKVSIDELSPGTALLVVRRGPNEGSKYMLDAEVTRAGRHPDSDIFLDDITVSRRHAEIIRRADGFYVADVGSLNGTYVNRDRVEDAKLANGDELQIGKFKLVFFAGH